MGSAGATPVRIKSASAVFLSAVLVTGLPLTSATAQTAYVGDEISISFRTGPGSQYAIERFLSTGAPLEVLPLPEDAEEDYGEVALEDWIYVRDNQGDEGWVQERFLMAEAPARVRIGQVEEERDAARERIAELEEELAEQTDEKDALSEELAEAEARIEELESDLEAASDGYELVEANEQLQERVARLLERNEQLEEQNTALAERSRQEWFLAGAGVLVGGLILGLILPHLRPRRRDGWGGGGL
nr:TIGR04211 family SH3 domain-containing protein [Halorhodospira halophila]